MEKWKKRAVELMTLLAFGGRNDPSVVPYYPQKTRINMPEEQFFARSTPEKHGISSKRIYNMLCELEGERHANIHTLMVLRGGEVISECSADGYSTGGWHISHSMAKTVCGMVIGTLIDEGRLKNDDRLVDIFPEIEYRDRKFPLITLEHLLSMTSGVEFAEAGVVTDSERFLDIEIYFSGEVKSGIVSPGSIDNIKYDLIVFNNKISRIIEYFSNGHPYVMFSYYVLLKQLSDYYKMINKKDGDQIDILVKQGIHSDNNEERIQILEKIFVSLDKDYRFDYDDYMLKLEL